MDWFQLLFSFEVLFGMTEEDIPTQISADIGLFEGQVKDAPTQISENHDPSKDLVKAVHLGSLWRFLELSSGARDAAANATTTYCKDLIQVADRIAKRRQTDGISYSDIEHAAQQIAFSPRKKLRGFIGTVFGGIFAGIELTNLFSATHQFSGVDIFLAVSAAILLGVSYKNT